MATPLQPEVQGEKEWEKEFDKKFGDIGNFYSDELNNFEEVVKKYITIKHFIQTLLSQEREKERRRILEEIIEKYGDYVSDCACGCTTFTMLKDDLLKSLKTLNNL